MVSGFLKERYGIRRVMECCISFCVGGERHQAQGCEYITGDDDEAQGRHQARERERFTAVVMRPSRRKRAAAEK